MPMRNSRLFLGASLVLVAAFPAIAQQSPPARALPCSDFTRNDDGDWVAKRDVTIQGPSGPVEFKIGVPVVDELQEQLDMQCKTTRTVTLPS